MIHHEYANVFRMLSQGELDKMVESIKANGQLLPIITYEGKILDGRNRFHACCIAGVRPIYEAYTGDDPLGAVSALNEDRRHETDSQRAMAGARLAALRHGGDRKSGGFQLSMDDLKTSKQTREAAAAAMKVSTASIDRARSIQNGCPPEIQQAVDDGQVSVRAAAGISKLTHEEQRSLLEDGPEAIVSKAAEIRCSRGTAVTTPEPEPEPEDEPETLVVDGSAESPEPVRMTKWVPNDANRLWRLAKLDLMKILPSDPSRERVLRKIVAYAKDRIASKK